MVSCWEEFQAHNWERYASVAGKPLPFIVLGTSILGFILKKYIGIQVYVFFLAFILAFFETPFVYACFGPCRRARDKLVDDFGFGKGWVKGGTFAALSIVCYLPKPSIAMLAGLLTDLVALLYIFSSAFADGSVGENLPAQNGYGSSTATGGFGTF